MKATRRRTRYSKVQSKKQRTRRKQHRRQKNTHKTKQKKRKQKKKTIRKRRKRGGMPGAPAHAAGGQAKKARTVPSEETAIHHFKNLENLENNIRATEERKTNGFQMNEIENRLLKIKSVPISKDLDEEGNEVSVTMFDILEMLDKPYDLTIGYDVPKLADEIIRKDIIPYIEGKSVLEPVEVLEIIIKKIINFQQSLYPPYVSMDSIDPVSKEEVIEFMNGLQDEMN